MKTIIALVGITLAAPSLLMIFIIASVVLKEKPVEIETPSPCAHIEHPTLDQRLADCK